MTPTRMLWLTTLLEGMSLALLVFVAMPLKYVAHWPTGVRVLGSLHGLLFLVFLVTLFRVATERRWPLSRTLVAIAYAVVPLAAFFFARTLRREAPADEERR